MSHKRLGIVLILLLAAALRLWALTDLPPGMTHDEADHGIDAWGVVQGIRPIYFPTASGREPFFDYASAILMAFLGPTILAGRLIAVYFSLILIAGTYAWTKLVFNQRVALLTAAGLAVNFWAIMTARHALRSVTMPALFVLGAFWFWYGVTAGRPTSPNHSARRAGSALFPFLLAGLFVGTSFYTYIPSRITWLLFPCMLGVWLLFDRAALRRHWHHVLLTVGVAAVVGFPLFYHLTTTDAEARVGDLSGPIDRARSGDFSSLIDNSVGALKLFTLTGDDGPISIRYNLPGRPLLPLVMGLLFYGGLLLAFVWLLRNQRWRGACAFALMWLVAGLSPSLVTGPEAATTRAIGMQPVLFLFPALALEFAWRRLMHLQAAEGVREPVLRIGFLVLIAGLYAYTGIEAAQAYFVEWANLPDVRVQYETTRVTALDWVNENGRGAVALASPRPDRFHDPSTGLMVLRNEAVTVRWFNGKSDDAASGSLLLPNSAESTLLISSWGDLHPMLQPYFDGVISAETIPMLASDLDRPIDIYQFDAIAHAQKIEANMTAIEPVTFGENVELIAYDLLSDGSENGMVQLAGLWRIKQPIDSLRLFTHLVNDPTQPPLAQTDRLDVPSFYWQPGDVFVQYHQFFVPPDLQGDFQLSVGAYQTLPNDQFPRLAASQNGTPLGSAYPLTTITLP